MTTPTGFDTKVGVFQITGSGADGSPLLLQDLRIEPVGQAGISVGRFTEATGTSVDYLSLDNVHVIGTNANPSTEQERGLYVDNTSTLDHLVIVDSAFNNLTYGWYFQKEVSADNSTVSNVQVTNTTFNHNNHKGIYVEKLEDATFSGCTFDQNGFDASVLPSYFQAWSAGVDINLKAGTYQNISFEDSVITDNALGGAKEGVGLTAKARDDAPSYDTYPASVTNVTITGNTITGNERGVRIGEPGKNNAGPTGVVIGDNNISNNVQKYTDSDGSAYGELINMSQAQVDASGNWFGVATPAGVAAVIYGDVDYTPWLASGTNNSTDPGFQGDFSNLWVDDDSPQSGSTGRIQEAIDLVSGSTVNVAAGTYTEQVVITSDLSLIGAGDDVTTIQAFASMPSCFTTTNDAYPIVCVKNAMATIDGFTIDGLGLGSSNTKFMGVAFRNAGGALKNSTVKDIRNEPFSGAQHGVGVYLYNDDTVDRDIDILDNNFTGFQKNAMAVNADASTPLGVDIQRNIVTGAGATTITAQNGIQVWGELVTGLISDNEISGIYYINPVDSCDYVASSILNYYADVDITNNTISGAQVAIYPYLAAGDITGNTISLTRQDQCWNEAIATYYPTANMSISNNEMTFDSNGLTGSDSYGIIVSVGDDDIAVTLDNNQVTDFDVGIDMYRGPSAVGDLTSISVTNNTLQTNLIDLWVEGALQANPYIYKNKFLGDAVGVQNDLDHQIDASLNYWGSACGPAVGAVVGGVIYAPWYTDAAMTTTGSGELGEFVFPTDSTTESMNAIIACASPGSTLTFEDPNYDYPGGLIVGADKTDLTFELNGVTVGPGSSAFKIYGDDITINGPGTLDGTGDTDDSPGILVADGADNLIVDGVYIEEWSDGIEVSGSHESFKVALSLL